MSSSLRSMVGVGIAAALLFLPVTACSSGDSGDDKAATTTSIASTTTEGASAASVTSAPAETTTTEASSDEISTTDVLDHLNQTAPDLGALFDWNTGDGIIAVSYLGTQTVGLYAMEIDADTAIKACEAASDFVYEKDPKAVIEVFTGGYSNSTRVAVGSGARGTCTAG